MPKRWSQFSFSENLVDDEGDEEEKTIHLKVGLTLE
jgi:hypothetical protein